MKNARVKLAILSVGLLAAMPMAHGMAATPQASSDVLVSAGVVTGTTVSSRSIVGSPVVSPLALPTGATSTVLTGTMSVTVQEIAMNGSANWNVSAIMSTDFARVGGGGTILKSALRLTPTAPVTTDLTSLTVSAGSAGTMDGAVTLFTVGGETSGSIYSNTYVGNGNLALTVPNGAAIGTYTATMTVTLSY